MTTEQFAQLQKSFSTYLGPDTYSKIAMLSPSEGEQVLKDTNTKMQNDATTSAEEWLNKLTSPYQEYAGMNIAAGQQFQQAVAPQEEEARKSSQYYQALVQKGPMFELAMRPELAKISPTFMGANRRDLDAKLTTEGITDPFQKQQMIDSYLSYADKAMTMSLSSLGQLYDSAVIAARTAAEDKQSIYQKVADIYKEAYSATLMANKDWLDSKINPKEGKDTPIMKEINGETFQWNDTLKLWEPAKTTLNQPIELTDTELRALVQAYKDTKKLTYEQAIANIDITSGIQNKDRAKEIVAEIYGKKIQQTGMLEGGSEQVGRNVGEMLPYLPGSLWETLTLKRAREKEILFFKGLRESLKEFNEDYLSIN